MRLVINKKNVELKIIEFFYILCFFSGIFSFLSYLVDNQYIKLWKEVYVILMCILFFDIKLKNININVLFFLLIGGGFFL